MFAVGDAAETYMIARSAFQSGRSTGPGRNPEQSTHSDPRMLGDQDDSSSGRSNFSLHINVPKFSVVKVEVLEFNNYRKYFFH